MNKSNKRVYMDIMRPAKQPSAEFLAAQERANAQIDPRLLARQRAEADAKAKALAAAKSRAQAHPVSTGDPFKTRPVMDTATLEARAKRQNFTDFHAPAPVARFSTSANSSNPRFTGTMRPAPAAPGSRLRSHVSAAPSRSAQTRVIEHASVKQTSVSEDSVTEFEFGVIEETTPAPAPAPVEPAKEKRPSLFKKSSPSASDKDAKSSKPAKTAPASPFLKNLSVPKRPLSASMPTGAHASVTPVAPISGTPLPAQAEKRRKRSSTPFIVIIILSILLGVTLGALVYFILPH